jgi:hypothetical protein
MKTFYKIATLATCLSISNSLFADNTQIPTSQVPNIGANTQAPIKQGKPSEQERQQRFLQHKQAELQILGQLQTCVNNAQNREQMHQCHENAKQAREQMKQKFQGEQKVYKQQGSAQGQQLAPSQQR